jgi:putative Holliday junction resolvase
MTAKIKNGDNYLALDVGDRRIGVAVASAVAKIATPLLTVENTDKVLDELVDICEAQAVGTVVVGLPRSMNGNETAQTKRSRHFADELAKRLQARVVLQDEALTSVQAERELSRRGKPYTKGDIDALAACLILDDYIQENVL